MRGWRQADEVTPPPRFFLAIKTQPHIKCRTTAADLAHLVLHI
jgi:hypothetical protein